VVAEVDGVKLTRAEFERSNPARLFQPRNTYFEAERKALDDYATEYLLEKQARKENLTVAQFLERAHHIIPRYPADLLNVTNFSELEAFRRRTNEEHSKEGVKLTMVALLLKASVVALRRFPQFNASLDGDDLVLKRYYHLGFAADTPQGLVVPVIRDVDRKGLIEIAGELTELSGRAREGKLKGEEMRGGTFTISSLGGIGGTGFTPIINAPEVAILGATRSALKPVWNGETVIVPPYPSKILMKDEQGRVRSGVPVMMVVAATSGAITTTSTTADSFGPRDPRSQLTACSSVSLHVPWSVVNESSVDPAGGSSVSEVVVAVPPMLVTVAS
jgi:hypothetical protein